MWSLDGEREERVQDSKRRVACARARERACCVCVCGRRTRWRCFAAVGPACYNIVWSCDWYAGECIPNERSRNGSS